MEGKTRRQFTADSKAEAVRMVAENGRRPKVVAGRLGISRSMLTLWCQEQEQRDREDEGVRSGKETKTGTPTTYSQLRTGQRVL